MYSLSVMTEDVTYLVYVLAAVVSELQNYSEALFS